ncbi:MAG TPA: hypothetical protein VNS49_10940, partial [Streptomyces sp.]|nr:hypothetical protein [Streptomyces sp.]
WLQHFFALKLVGTVMPWTAVVVAGAASAALEVAWRWVKRPGAGAGRGARGTTGNPGTPGPPG